MYKILLALLLFITVFTGCATRVPNSRPYSDIPIKYSTHGTYSINARGEWQPTTISLSKGDRFFIDAKGTWSGGMGWAGGPRGSVGWDAGRIYPDERAATALIGRVGNGSPFTIGDQYLGKAEFEGNLYMRMNDPLWGDNSGSLTVNVYVSSQKIQTEKNRRKKNQHILEIQSQKQMSANDQPLVVKDNWAVIIGISKYQFSGENGLVNLIFADEDAKDFARSLHNLGWNESHIKLLTNEEATQRNIVIALESWLSKAGPNDQIILFWAGHGFPDPEDPEKVFFATYDTDIKIPATGYRMDRVRAALEERKSKNVILFADTCHAGKLITRGERGISIIPNIKKQNTPKGWVFMVGADTDRKAIEDSSWSNGAFTHSLVNGLNGAADGFQSIGPKDGVVTMGELRAYMNTAMPEETQKILGVAKRPVITTSTGDPDIWNLTLQVSQ